MSTIMEEGKFWIQTSCRLGEIGFNQAILAQDTIWVAPHGQTRLWGQWKRDLVFMKVWWFYVNADQPTPHYESVLFYSYYVHCLHKSADTR